MKHLDGISDADIVELNIPTGNPLVYELDEHMAPMEQLSIWDRYLDRDAAHAAAEAVARQAG